MDWLDHVAWIGAVDWTSVGEHALAGVGALYLAARAIVRATPTKADDRILASIRTFGLRLLGRDTNKNGPA